ncbi:uncharacterized protein EAE98_003940 [Botrytis deweyae]|uniref:Uncharacterized protein n=1 Tax=Botrytis deweyae TaxID=2478750 RepID=A0ABQ7IS50_9HELO|nr:uncharacterized protein EAE98_003940 [Botrytis deweyae]KAF7932641.1 hypothetical protein EAE98_003940 [Botrytis deweyae]
MPTSPEFDSLESPSSESASPESPSSESPSSESLSPESPPPKFISPSSEPLSPEPSLLKFISPESPSSRSPSPKPQCALFVDRGLKVQVCLDVLVEKGGYNSVRGRGPPILSDNLLDIDSPQDWWQMLRNLQQIIDLQLVPLLGVSPEIVDVFVVWDGDVPPECDGWSEWSEWLKCKRWNEIGVKTMRLYKREKGPRYRVNFEFLLELLAERDYRDVIFCSIHRPPSQKTLQ